MLIKRKKMPKYSAILMRIFKEEAELEVWKQDPHRPFPVPQNLSDLLLVWRYWAEGA
jgi:hypothetical protein